MTPDNRLTPPTSTRTTAPPATPPDTRPDLHLSQVLAGALAAVTSAVVGSTLGVAGTLGGAAVGSIVATLGGGLYTYWLRRTGHRVRAVVLRSGDTVLVNPANLAPALADVDLHDPRPRQTASPRRWRLAAALSIAAFMLGMGAITTFEALAGRPVSSLTTGTRDSGTSLRHALGSSSRLDAPPASSTSDPTPPSSPTPTPTSTPSSTPTPTDPTDPASPTPTATPPPTDEPTGTPTAPPT